MSKRTFAAIWMLVFACLVWAQESEKLQAPLNDWRAVLAFSSGGAAAGWFLLSRAIGHKSNYFLTVSAGIVGAILAVPVAAMGFVVVLLAEIPAMLDDPEWVLAFILVTTLVGMTVFWWAILSLGAAAGLSSHFVWLRIEKKFGLT